MAAGPAAAGLAVVVVDPARVRAFAVAPGRRAETEPLDAAAIARFAAATQPEVRPLPDAQTRRLAELAARRRQIVHRLTAGRHRRSRTLGRRTAASCDRLIRAVEREPAGLDGELGQAVRGSAVWREKPDPLRSVPGAGPVVSRTLLAELPESGTLDRRRIAALCGRAPGTRQSGPWRGKRFLGGGRAGVRSALFLAAMVAAKRNRLLRTFYRRLLTKGKTRIAALVAVARKRPVVLNAILRTGARGDEVKQANPSI